MEFNVPVSKNVLAAIRDKIIKKQADFLRSAALKYGINDTPEITEGYFSHYPRIEGRFAVKESLVFKINTGHLNFPETPACVLGLCYAMIFQLNVNGHLPGLMKKTIDELLTYDGKKGAVVSHVADIRYHGIVNPNDFPGYLEVTHLKTNGDNGSVFQANASFGPNREHTVENITFGVRF